MQSIPESQFNALMEISSLMKVKHAELLPKWYEFDANAVPPCYSLKASAAVAAFILPTFITSSPFDSVCSMLIAWKIRCTISRTQGLKCNFKVVGTTKIPGPL